MSTIADFAASLEPDVTTLDGTAQDITLLSIAISAKRSADDITRIANALEAFPAQLTNILNSVTVQTRDVT